MAKVFLIDGTAAIRNSPFLAQPLGLLGLASILRQEGHDVQVFDCKLEVTTLQRRLVDFGPDVVGIRTLSMFAHMLTYLGGMVRQLLPRASVIVGGPHANADPADAILRSGAVCAVIGEGEPTIVELVDSLLSRGTLSLSGVDGIAYLEGGELVFTRPREPVADLDSLPFPAYDLLPMELYFSLHHGGTAPSGRTMTAFTSRGCPYGCAFCHNIFGKAFRARSADAVVDEVLYLKRRYGIEEVEIHDDCFNLDRTRMVDICHGLRAAGSPVSLAFPNGLRADILTRELLEELRLAGTHHIALSPETASPRLQRFIGKRMDLDRLFDMAAVCDDLGIFSLGYFMLGFPTETEEEMLQTVEWACDSPLHVASFFNVMPYPGTRLYEAALESGKLPEGWSGHNYFIPDVNVSEVPDDRFKEIWHGAYRRFYLNPRRVLSILRNVTNAGTLFRNTLFVAARFMGGR